MFSFKALDNMVYTDLLSERTILSPNYKPAKDPQERKQIIFNSPHNLKGKIKKFVFPKNESSKKLLMGMKNTLSFVDRYKPKETYQ